MRLGLLGLGRIGAFHAETLAGLPAVQELVLSDPLPALAEQAAGRLGARIAESPAAVLASGVDGIVIAAPTSFHAELIELCLATGLPTFCEKPAACDSDEAFFMDRLAGAFRAELAAFTEVVAGRRASPCTVLDAIETGWVAEACTLSLNEHRPVRIEEVRRVR